MQFSEYVNIVLQGINEVSLTPQQINTARGLHQFVKESINRAYTDIVNDGSTWPWLQAGSGTVLTKELSGETSLVPQAMWTLIPVVNPYKDAVDWSSIYYRNKDNDKQSLTFLTWEEFEDFQDYVEGFTGEPRFIVQAADGKSIGLYPTPESADMGKLFFRVWTRPLRYNLAEDEVNFPEQYYNVIINGALSYVNDFRSDQDQANVYLQRFNIGLKQLKQRFGNQGSRLRFV